MIEVLIIVGIVVAVLIALDALLVFVIVLLTHRRELLDSELLDAEVEAHALAAQDWLDDRADAEGDRGGAGTVVELDKARRRRLRSGVVSPKYGRRHR